MAPTALKARRLEVSLAGRPVLHGLDLDIAAGQWTSIIGPNGAGKSTVLKALAGLLPAGGSVELLGQPLHSLPARTRALRMAWLGQNESTGDDLKVWDVAMLGRLPHQSLLGASSPADHAAVEQALRATQAWDWRERALGQLSAGERQRGLLARALAVEGKGRLMDEPLANLDPPHQADWLQLVRALVTQSCTVVSVLHEISMALHADTMLVMVQGRITHHGPCSDAQTHRAVEQVFDHRLAIHALAGQWVAIPSNI